jgi:hypothetical protein
MNLRAFCATKVHLEERELQKHMWGQVGMHGLVVRLIQAKPHIWQKQKTQSDTE